MLPFNISVEKKWVMRSWDHFEIPRPFSRAVVLIGKPIYVDKGRTGQEMQSCEAQIQQSLDELRDRGDNSWNRKPDR